MAGRAVHGAQSDARAVLVKLGRLCFDDFLLLPPQTLASGLRASDLASDWSLALNNSPHIVLHLRRSVNLQSGICNLQSSVAMEDIHAARQRLVHAFAYELLRAKAPPLYDALPWHDWDFSIVAKRFKLWQTRFLLAGDGTTVTMCRCRKSAGVYVMEPCEAMARYIERKAALERVRHLRVLHSSLTPTLPLPSSSVDLAVLGSLPDLETGNWKLVIDELIRVAANVLLIENNPILQPLDERSLIDTGFRPDSVDVSGLGPRRCWWKRA